jgi:hypothetical protein
MRSISFIRKTGAACQSTNPRDFFSQFCKLTATSETSTPLDFHKFRSILARFRSEISSRQLISQTSDVKASEEERKIGEVTYTCRISGMKAGEAVEATIVVAVRIGWDEDEERRVVDMQSFVCSLL